MVKLCAVVFGSDPALWMMGEVGRGEATFIACRQRNPVQMYSVHMSAGRSCATHRVAPHTYTTETRAHGAHHTVTQQLHHSQVPNIHACMLEAGVCAGELWAW
jgi:hypothetical protein